MTFADAPDLETSAPASDGNAKAYSVSELAFALKRTLETTYGFVRLRGELSKVTFHSNGHVYLSIKDEKACIDGVVCGRESSTTVSSISMTPSCFGFVLAATGCNAAQTLA